MGDQNTEGKFEDKIIEVCANCGLACCWYGEFMCECADRTGTIKMTVSELRLRISHSRESEDYWSDEYMEKIYGNKAPFGYKEKK